MEPYKEPQDESQEQSQDDPLESLAEVFRNQLVACLEECARGRRGLFAERVTKEAPWPEAARLRELAIALQAVFAQQGQENPLADEFLDLCTIHGENDPGESRLARAFLARMEKGEVGARPEGERKPW